MNPASTRPILCFCLLLFSPTLWPAEQPTKTITDASAWNHPVHTVFEKNKIELTKVEFYKDNKYPVFFAKPTFDPTSAETEKFYNKLYFDVLQANGYWDYAINDPDDNLVIKVHWDKQSKNMTKTFEDTGDKRD